MTTFASSSSSASASEIRFNKEGKELKSDRPRNGEFAELYDRRALIYEEGRCCDTYHPNASGWRCGGETCGKVRHALGQSVSFGRFMSESLDCDKWSSFSSNPYVEEAKRYSRPGSVAQKKAFFEAHYKKRAEQSLDTSSRIEDASNNVSTPDSQILMPLSTQNQVKTPEDNPHVLVDNSESNKDNNVAQLKSESNKVNELAQLKAALDTQEEYNPKLVGKSESNKIELTESTELLIERKVDVDNNVDIESGSTQMERPPLKSSNQDNGVVLMSKKKPALSSSRSLTYGKSVKLPSSPAKKTTLIHPKKENVATSINKKPVKDSVDKRRMTPKSLHKSLYLTPAREVNRLASSVIRKIDSSRVGSKDCSTSLKTPTTASKSGVPKQHLSPPLSEKKRDGVPLESSTSRSKAVLAKWHFLPTDCSKFLSACRIKSQSPCFSPFNFRTEERAAKRKQNLEKKFNANQAQKLKQQENNPYVLADNSESNNISTPVSQIMPLNTQDEVKAQKDNPYVLVDNSESNKVKEIAKVALDTQEEIQAEEYSLNELVDKSESNTVELTETTDLGIERNVHVENNVNMESGFTQMEKPPLKGNPIHALGQSISFGRFMSESLDWEKWSSFSSNRYVEEAERCCCP